MKKVFWKRQISFFLALIMLFQFVVPQFFDVSYEVLAADSTFNVHIDNTLIIEPNSGTPSIPDIPPSDNGENVLIRWNFPSIGSHQYLLKVVLDESSRETFYAYVTRDNNNPEAPISFSYMFSNNHVAGTLDETNLKNTITLPTIRTIGIQSSYINYEDYMQSDHQVRAESGDFASTGLPPEFPTFSMPQIESGIGLATKYNNMDINFLYSGGRFYLSLNVIGHDYIYDFSLYHISSILTNATDLDERIEKIVALENQANLPTVPTPITVTNFPVYRGLASPTTGRTAFASEPFAQVEDDRGYRDKIVNLNIENEFPAKDPNGIRFRIWLPERWDDANQEFKIIDSSANIGLTFGLTDKSGSDFSVTAEIDNVGVDKNEWFVDGHGQEITAEYLHDETQGWGELIIEGLPSGVIFDARIRTNYHSSNPINPVSQTVTKTRNEVYTFLSYNIQYRNGFYYLAIVPYKHQGEYIIETENSPSVSINHNGSGNTIYIGVPVWREAHTSYKVIFKPEAQIGNPQLDDDVIESQTSRYRPPEDNPIISPPEDFSIVDQNLSALSKLDEYHERQADLSLRLSWNIGFESDIKDWIRDEVENHGREAILHYELYQTLSPVSDNVSHLFDTLELKLEVQTVDGREIVNASYRGLNEDTFIIPGEINDITNIRNRDIAWKQVGTRIMLRTDISLNMRIGNVSVYGSHNPIPQERLFFFYPGIYFLHVASIDISMEENDPTRNLGLSNYEPLTLDLPDILKIPTAQNLRAYDPVTTSKGAYNQDTGEIAEKNEVSFLAEWTVPVRSLRNYLDDSYTWSNPTLKYSLYISQEYDIAESISDQDNIVEAVYNGNGATDPTTGEIILYFSEINDGVRTVLPNDTALRALREGKIIRVNDIPVDIALYFQYLDIGQSIPSFSIKLDGLDKNQRYHIAVDSTLSFVASFIDANNIQFQEIVTEHSDLSNIAAILTKSDMDIPSPDENIPGTPYPLWARELSRSTSLTIHWNKLQDIRDSNGNYVATNNYEIIRLKGTQIDDELLKLRNISIVDYMELIDTSIPKIAISTILSNNAPNNIQMLINGSFVNPPNGELFVCDDTTYPGEVWITDNTCEPNTIYFYYVRTVQTAGGIKTYSPWAGVSATTNPVESPENLFVLRSDDYEYDPQTEFYISFDAPLGSLDALGIDYDLQYSLRLGSNDWQTPVTMSVQLLKSLATPIIMSDGNPGFRFIYKITGLTPGSFYSIRVRMIDVNGDASPYSNTAQHRTDMDQKDYDEIRETDDWVNFLKNELGTLVREPVWYAQDTSSMLVVFYRPTMFNGILASATDAEVSLITSAQGAKELVYYFPSSVINDAARNNKVFTISDNDGLKIILSQNFVDVIYNDTVFSVENEIKQKNYSDYAIRVTITYTEINDNIEGNQAVGSQVAVNVECIATTNSVPTWDNNILNMYLSRIEQISSSTEYEDVFRQMVENGTAHTEMVKYVADVIAKTRLSLVSDTNESLARLVADVFRISRLDSPITIARQNPVPNAVLRGFQKQSTSDIWQSVELSDYNNGKAIITLTTGMFVFTGHTANLTGIESMKDSVVLTTIIAKYSLDDYLGRGASFSLDNAISVHAVTGIVARMAGATQTADPIAFMQSKGYTVSQRNTNNATTQETIYLFMALYEIKTKTNVETMRIRDYSKTAKINGIDDRYLKSIQAAFEMGIYNDPEMSPRGSMTTEDVLEIISALNKKVRL